MQALRWHEEDQGQTFDLTDIPAELGAEAEEAREKLVEAVASEDDTLLKNILRVRKSRKKIFWTGFVGRHYKTDSSRCYVERL